MLPRHAADIYAASHLMMRWVGAGRTGTLGCVVTGMCEEAVRSDAAASSLSD